MWDTCAVDLRVTVPRQLAPEVEEVQRRDPEMLSWLLQFMLTQKMIYEHLSRTKLGAADR